MRHRTNVRMPLFLEPSGDFEVCHRARRVSPQPVQSAPCREAIHPRTARCDLRSRRGLRCCGNLVVSEWATCFLELCRNHR